MTYTASFSAPSEAFEKSQDDLRKQAIIDQRQNYYKSTLGYALGLAGNVTGILVAIKRKSGFWGGVGWFLLLGAAGAAAGLTIGSIMDGKPKE